MTPLGKKCLAVGFLAYLGLWIAGTIHAWSLPHPEPSKLRLALSSDEYSGKLPAANNLVELKGMAETPLPLMLEQLDLAKVRVFEKSAQLTSATPSFDDHQARIRAALTASSAVIFNDKLAGIAPQRRCTLEVGVDPNKFDALVAELQSIGHLESLTIQQRDRTGEFRRLHAQRQSTKSHLESVAKLRAAKNPSIDDALKLEQKIQDIEKELQGLGVQLGELLGKESFYHVSLTLVEYQPGDRLDREFTPSQRVFQGFLWALPWWFALVLAVGVFAGTYMSVVTLWRAPA